MTYFFNGGANQTFTFDENVGGGATAGTFDGDSGPVKNTWDSSVDTANFPSGPSDGATARVTATILNNTDTGIIAAAGRINVSIKENSGTTVIAGGRTVDKK